MHLSKFLVRHIPDRGSITLLRVLQLELSLLFLFLGFRVCSLSNLGASTYLGIFCPKTCIISVSGFLLLFEFLSEFPLALKSRVFFVPKFADKFWDKKYPNFLIYRIETPTNPVIHQALHVIHLVSMCRYDAGPRSASGIFCPKFCIICVHFFCHFSNFLRNSRWFLKIGYFLSPNLQTNFGTKNTLI